MLSGANNELVLCCVQIPLGQEEWGQVPRGQDFSL
jgi:hypothetical protein